MQTNHPEARKAKCRPQTVKWAGQQARTHTLFSSLMTPFSLLFSISWFLFFFDGSVLGVETHVTGLHRRNILQARVPDRKDIPGICPPSLSSVTGSATWIPVWMIGEMFYTHVLNQACDMTGIPQYQGAQDSLWLWAGVQKSYSGQD